jgi:hypothetical protein
MHARMYIISLQQLMKATKEVNSSYTVDISSKLVSSSVLGKWIQTYLDSKPLSKTPSMKQMMTWSNRITSLSIHPK